MVILLLVPARSFLLPRWFSRQELSILDAPTASPFTMESVGGSYGHGDDHESPAGQSSMMEQEEGRSELAQESAVEDELERGDLYELQPRNPTRRRSRIGK